MYAQMLAHGDTQFADAVRRPGIFVHPTAELRSVLDAVHACQAARVVENIREQELRTLLTRMFSWRTAQPHEFADRGASAGAGYRLWMEAKQILQNKRRAAYADHADPSQPAGCPGTTLLGTYVPPNPPQPGGAPGSNDADEICHQFSYRWLVASGRLPYAPEYGDAGNRLFPNDVARRVLFPPVSAPALAYQPANLGGHLMVRAGDLIGVFTVEGPRGLQHSLIAEAPNCWVGANNTATFGERLGRTKVVPLGHRWVVRAGLGRLVTEIGRFEVDVRIRRLQPWR